MIKVRGIDFEDNLDNLRAAADRGFVTHRFVSAESLADALRRYGLTDPETEK